jgi:hypothetical protein
LRYVVAGVAGADDDGALSLTLDGGGAGEFGGVAEEAFEGGEAWDVGGDVGLAACSGCLDEVLLLLV